MWTAETRDRYNRDQLRYPSDLTDEEWSLVGTLITAVQRCWISSNFRSGCSPPSAARYRSCWSVSDRFAMRMLKAKLRMRANTPGLDRMRDRSSPMVTSRQ